MSVITALRASANGAAIRVERDGAKWLRLPVHLVADLGLFTGEEMDEARVAQVEEAAALARLSAAGLSDEQANADQRVERLAGRGWPARRIRSEMLRVGFAGDVVARAVDEGLPDDHDAALLERALERSGIPESAADRSRLADRLVRQGFPPAAVREAVRPHDGTPPSRDSAAPEADAHNPQVRRRDPGPASGSAARWAGWHGAACAPTTPVASWRPRPASPRSSGR